MKRRDAVSSDTIIRVMEMSERVVRHRFGEGDLTIVETVDRIIKLGDYILDKMYPAKEE